MRAVGGAAGRGHATGGIDDHAEATLFPHSGHGSTGNTSQTHQFGILGRVAYFERRGALDRNDALRPFFPDLLDNGKVVEPLAVELRIQQSDDLSHTQIVIDCDRSRTQCNIIRIKEIQDYQFGHAFTQRTVCRLCGGGIRIGAVGLRADGHVVISGSAADESYSIAGQDPGIEVHLLAGNHGRLGVRSGPGHAHGADRAAGDRRTPDIDVVGA